MITREFLERAYVRGHRTVKQIAVQTGVPRYMVSDQVRALGFTLGTAAEHLGAHPTALVTQLQRLEHDIGAPLYHRATPGRPLHPTPQGSSLLRVLRQPDIHHLLLADASGGTRSTHRPIHG